MSTTTHESSRPYGVAPSGPRLPDATRVGGVRLQVTDLARSVAYYRDVLGLTVLHDRAGRAELGAPGDERPLVSLEPGASHPASRRRAFGLYHFAILLPDRAALGRFASHLADRQVRVGMADHRVSEALYLTDPDGLGIEVYRDRPRESWAHHGRELAMSTEPLDAHAVIAAGAGEPWRGAPRGTTMGHIHLHVGDLAEAEAFYHRGLGLEKMVWSYPGALFLAAGGYHHHLGVNTWSPGPVPAADQARLLEWALLVPSADDARLALARLRHAGYSVADDVAEDPRGTRLRITAS